MRGVTKIQTNRVYVLEILYYRSYFSIPHLELSYYGTKMGKLISGRGSAVRTSEMEGETDR